MLRVLACAACFSALLGNLQAQSDDPATESQEFQSLEERVSYAIGLNIGRNLQREGIEVDPALLAEGIRDVLSGADPKLTDEQIDAALTEYQTQLRERMAARREADAASNEEAGAAFLRENADREGVVTLPSGLQYEIVSAGDGAQPTAADRVQVHYAGTLIDGTQFDSSYDRGEPAEFGVGEVIPGWTEILQLMPVGSKWKVYIPSELGYGQRGAGDKIGPNAVLVFEIELLQIVQ